MTKKPKRSKTPLGELGSSCFECDNGHYTKLAVPGTYEGFRAEIKIEGFPLYTCNKCDGYLVNGLLNGMVDELEAAIIIIQHREAGTQPSDRDQVWIRKVIGLSEKQLLNLARRSKTSPWEVLLKKSIPALRPYPHIWKKKPRKPKPKR